MPFDVFALGSPLIDLLGNVDDNFLKERNIESDRMYLLDAESQRALLQQVKQHSHEVITAPGGSAANTAIGISQLGGKVAFSGRVGNDDNGRIYRQKMNDAHVTTHLGQGEGDTGSSLILVTPNGSRTMNTCLAESQNFVEDDLNLEAIADSRYIYIEGYLWDTDNQKKAVMKAVQTAKQHGVKVAMSLSDAFCVHRHKAEFMSLLKDQVDLVFCNQDEAFAMTGSTVSQTAIERLSMMCSTVALTMGARGSLLAEKGETVYIDPVATQVKDTTGAGDAFAAGLLYGLTQGRSLFESGHIATFLASHVISHVGARCQDNIRQLLSEYLQSFS